MNITSNAEKRLQKMLDIGAQNSEKMIRIIKSKTKDDAYELVLDAKHEGDEVVPSSKNDPLLAISNDLSSQLDGMILDYEEMRNGGIFSIHATHEENTYLTGG